MAIREKMLLKLFLLILASLYFVHAETNETVTCTVLLGGGFGGGFGTGCILTFILRCLYYA